MPSKSAKQRKTMAAACHNEKYAKKMKIPQDVACEYNRADKKHDPMREGYHKL